MAIVMIVVAVALVVGLAAFLLSRGASDAASPAAEASPTPTPTVLPQARWKVRAFPSGLLGQVGKQAVKAAHRQARKAAKAVKHIYYVLLLDPPATEDLIRSRFEPAAARAFLHARARLPGRLSLVRTTHRFLKIGVDAASRRRAVARVGIVMKATRNSHRVKIKQKSTLWLERVHRLWKVLAWRAQQGPA